MTSRHPACHGVAVSPAEIGLQLGWLSEPPPLSVEVELVDSVERAPDAELVWELVEPPGFGLPEITSQTWDEPSGCVWIGNTLNMALRVDHHRSRVTVAARNDNRQVVLEALASIALPLVAQRSGYLVLHASAAARDGSAVVVCAQSGSGKSSLLMGLAASGWDPLSEDQCAIDFDAAGGPRLWPGPSWVRLKHGSPPPALVAEQAPRFEALDKIGWDIGDRVAHAPARIERIVFLDPPGSERVEWAPLPEAAVIAALLPQATWMQRRDAYAQSVLPLLAKLAMSVPTYRMRLPLQADWLHTAVSVLDDR